MVHSHLCVLIERPDPSRGGALRWSLPFAELCLCQRMVAPVLKSPCPQRVDGDLWFVDDPRTLTMRHNWKKDILDELLNRTHRCVCSNEWNGNCYNYVNISKSWSDAEMYCISQYEAHLVSIHSSAEHIAVKEHIGDNDAWIGLSDQTTENTFKWSDGTQYDYTNWYPGEPSSQYLTAQSDIEDCVSFRDTSGVWNDLPCTEKKKFVCK
ncbi:C-type lectin mannose-binding isoform-like [Amphiura filiformis]|uniref:C-type lectin mannose-binding isoform-like n=1 Tax=Amphiura filiformis TaxID=82378 RepID=UPI003B2260A9